MSRILGVTHSKHGVDDHSHHWPLPEPVEIADLTTTLGKRENRKLKGFLDQMARKRASISSNDKRLASIQEERGSEESGGVGDPPRRVGDRSRGESLVLVAGGGVALDSARSPGGSSSSSGGDGTESGGDGSDSGADTWAGPEREQSGSGSLTPGGVSSLTPSSSSSGPSSGSANTPSATASPFPSVQTLTDEAEARLQDTPSDVAEHPGHDVAGHPGHGDIEEAVPLLLAWSGERPRPPRRGRGGAEGEDESETKGFVLPSLSLSLFLNCFAALVVGIVVVTMILNSTALKSSNDDLVFLSPTASEGGGKPGGTVVGGGSGGTGGGGTGPDSTGGGTAPDDDHGDTGVVGDPVNSAPVNKAPGNNAPVNNAPPPVNNGLPTSSPAPSVSVPGKSPGLVRTPPVNQPSTPAQPQASPAPAVGGFHRSRSVPAMAIVTPAELAEGVFKRVVGYLGDGSPSIPLSSPTGSSTPRLFSSDSTVDIAGFGLGTAGDWRSIADETPLRRTETAPATLQDASGAPSSRHRATSSVIEQQVVGKDAVPTPPLSAVLPSEEQTSLVTELSPPPQFPSTSAGGNPNVKIANYVAIFPGNSGGGTSPLLQRSRSVPGSNRGLAGQDPGDPFSSLSPPVEVDDASWVDHVPANEALRNDSVSLFPGSRAPPQLTVSTPALAGAVPGEAQTATDSDRVVEQEVVGKDVVSSSSSMKPLPIPAGNGPPTPAQAPLTTPAGLPRAVLDGLYQRVEPTVAKREAAAEARLEIAKNKIRDRKIEEITSESDQLYAKANIMPKELFNRRWQDMDRRWRSLLRRDMPEVTENLGCRPHALKRLDPHLKQEELDKDQRKFVAEICSASKPKGEKSDQTQQHILADDIEAAADGIRDADPKESEEATPAMLVKLLDAIPAVVLDDDTNGRGQSLAFNEDLQCRIALFLGFNHHDGIKMVELITGIEQPVVKVGETFFPGHLCRIGNSFIGLNSSTRLVCLFLEVPWKFDARATMSFKKSPPLSGRQEPSLVKFRDLVADSSNTLLLIL